MVDFSFLRQRGIELLQQICGESWTDYNLHDPGVTILEALCYALTDLSYRTEFPMQDLLADKEGKIRLHHNAFFTREEILSTNPVSVTDCRKFILDRLDNLHNVWLEPFMSGFSFGTMHGLYTMKVQVKKEFSVHLEAAGAHEQATGAKPTSGAGAITAPSPTPGAAHPPADNAWASDLTKEVRACFVSARNLCEDLVRHITVLRPVPIRIRAEVIMTGDQPESILAHIYRELETAINPPVRYYTERELLDKGFRVEDIHAGPRLRKGFIRDDELPARKLAVDPAELMKAIAGVPGVSYVRSLTILTPEGPADRIPYRLPEDGYPYFLDGPDESPIQLLRGKYEVRISESVFNDIWPRVKEAARRSVQPVVDPQASPDIRHGQYRELMFYHSLQHLFPVVYGIGPEGLGRNPSPERMAKARQLKGYLLSFEQLLADYLAQLGHLSDFFSVENMGRTYYTQPLYEVPDIRPLLKAFTAPADPAGAATLPSPADDKAWRAFMADDRNSYVQTLAKSAETEEDYLQRRNAVLDHLLARFNLRLSDYPVWLFTRLYTAQGIENKQDPVLEWKSALLKNIVGLSYDRVRGFDYLAGDRHDNGGFYRNMMALLYIRPGSHSAAAAGSHAAPPLSAAVFPHMTLQPGQPAAAASQDTTDPRPAVSPGEAPSLKHRSMAFFLHGLNAANYTIGPDPNSQGWLILFKDPAETAWQTVSRHAGKAAAIKAQQHLMEQLRQMSILSEGFYLIEHVLLRPPVDAEAFGFRFMATRQEKLLQHAGWTSFLRREQILTEILRDAAQAPQSQPPPGPSAAAPPDPSISEWGVNCLGGRCRIQLTRHKDFGFLSDPADFEPWIWAEAAPDIDRIRRQLLLFNENRLRFYPRFEMLVRGHDDNPIREEFFNFNMTVLLPAWPARFQEPNFRAFLMDVFRQHTPAHIRLYFQWLNVSRMKEFEDIYPRWIIAMRDQDNTGPRQHWSERIIHFIKKGIY